MVERGCPFRIGDARGLLDQEWGNSDGRAWLVMRQYACFHVIRLEPGGCQFRDQHSAILPFSEASEPVLQMPRNVEERIQTMSESRRVRQYRDYDRAVARWAVNTLFLRRYDGLMGFVLKNVATLLLR